MRLPALKSPHAAGSHLPFGATNLRVRRRPFPHFQPQAGPSTEFSSD
jgi:hypothetical protein